MDKKGIVFGAGLSGLGAKELLEKNGYEVYLIDDKVALPSEEGIRLLNEGGIEFVVKSPGIPWKAELLKIAKGMATVPLCVEIKNNIKNKRNNIY